MNEDDIRASLLEAFEAYKRKAMQPPEPLGPLVVPDWLPAAWSREHPNDDLDEVSRRYGFDGYITVSESWG